MNTKDYENTGRQKEQLKGILTPDRISINRKHKLSNDKCQKGDK